METVTIPKDEYVRLKKEIEILKDTPFLRKVDDLIDILFQEKYNLVITDYTEDLTEHTINNVKDWQEKSAWDHV
ncbi:hypothetical protein H8E88_31605 [candidate division KSB1 bacterium]|nr:hypothetical protein [candidate division KSB1 bacterium]MBL7095880.1 hypothetical protein [candidate division KSB1 bacterium]